jgi:DNA polymerase-3 subunit delta'
MFFKDIAGQENVKSKLIQSVQNQRISHAWLFTGPEGNGKLALAIAYAQYLSCKNKQVNDSCGTCESCVKYEKLIHPDLHFVYPVIKTKKNQKPISDDFIQEWRKYIFNFPYYSLNNWLTELGVENQQAGIFTQESAEIIRKLNLKSFEAEYKVMIIWMPERMNATASNKLLKIIEEPPPKTVFILVSDDTEKIINTILSRTQLLKIPKIGSESMFDKIKEKYNFADEIVHDIVNISNGNFSVARNLIYQIENKNESEQFVRFAELMRYAYGLKIIELQEWIEQISRTGREYQKQFLLYALRMLRENFILNKSPENKDDILFLTNKERDFSEKFNTFIHQKNIYDLTNEFNEAYNHIERNGYSKLIFMDLALKTARLLKVKPQ